MWDVAQMSSAEVAELRERYEPLTASIRALVDAALRTDAGDDVVALATAEVDAVTARLREHQREGWLPLTVTPDGQNIGWGNMADGIRNPLAPPLVVEFDGPTKAHIDVDLGAAYEGAPGHLHGGYCAVVIDHLMGYVASYGEVGTVAATGTISFRYQRPTRLGSVRVEAEIQRTEGRKIFVAGHLADADGVTVTAEGLFISLQR